MRAARQRLARARQRLRRLSWLAREPESLDSDLPLLSRAAFVRALARFQVIRLHAEKACLLALRLDRADLPLRRAVAMHLLENTRNCDIVACADARTFLLLLKGADDEGGWAAARRLRDGIRRLAAHRGRLLRVRIACQPLSATEGAAGIVHRLLGQLPEWKEAPPVAG